MMAKLSLYVRKRVFLENHTARPMKKNRESLLQEGIKTSSCEISLFLCRYRKTGRLIDAPKLKQEHLDFINQQQIFEFKGFYLR